MAIDKSKSKKGASVSDKFPLLNWSSAGPFVQKFSKSSRYLDLRVERFNNISLVLVRKRENEISLVTKRKQICNK